MHEVDLLDSGSILRCLLSSEPEAIFHFAANPDKGFDIPSAILQNNAVGTANLLEACRHRQRIDGSGLQVFVNVSSSEVYGDVRSEDVPIKETCSFRPVSPYAISKVAQDHLGAMYANAYGLRVVTTRAFSYVNYYHHGLFTSHFARQIAEIEAGKRKVLEHGNLDSVRTFVDSKSLMSAYWHAACLGRVGEAYNIGGDHVASVADVLISMCGFASCPIRCRPDPSLSRPADVTQQIPDCSKFREHTGWKPEPMDLVRLLRGNIDYWRKRVQG